VGTTVTQTATGLAKAWDVSPGAGAVVAIVDEDASARYHPAFTGGNRDWCRVWRWRSV